MDKRANSERSSSPKHEIVDDSVIPSGIQYVGLPGIPRDCQVGVLRLLQYGDRITLARILSSSNDHCLLLTVGVGDIVAVKSGFSSGYYGEGPRTFSHALQVLDVFGVEIEEYVVSAEVIERVDKSSLTRADLRAVDTARPVRPRRWDEYILEHSFEPLERDILRHLFRPVIPFGIIDNRIADLAISFWQSPDERLLTGYRRLEDIVRLRTGIDEHGAKLFSSAFDPKAGKLIWTDASMAERVGKMNLFTGAYMAYRNPRAHRELKDRSGSLLSELLLLDNLYILENQSKKV